MKIIRTVDNEIEAQMIAEIFDDYGIEHQSAHRESGAFMQIYMGNSPYGIDIYVAEKDVDKATELVEAFFSGHYDAPETSES
ncbi:putative signal transducing protein [Fusibacter sp. JL298sf-3]